MTKAELVAKIAEKTGVEKANTQAVIESFMEITKDSIVNGEPIYLRGFGSFIRKTRAQKMGHNCKKGPEGRAILIPEHNIPAFKPSKIFINEVRNN